MADTTKMNLSRPYTYAGKLYGPGEAEVPADAAADLRKKEEGFQQRLADGYEPPAPVTPAAAGGGLVDPRRRPAVAPMPDAVPNPDDAPRRNVAQEQARRSAKTDGDDKGKH